MTADGTPPALPGIVERRTIVLYGSTHCWQRALDHHTEWNGDMVIVEPGVSAFARIAGAAPQMIVAAFEIDDPAAMRLLGMLTSDGRTAHIPVVTCVVRPALSPVPEPPLDPGMGPLTQRVARAMN